MDNLVLISIDSLRADMPWAGYPRAIAPRLTALEAKSVSLTQAYALSSYTSMSVGGFLAGDYPSELKRDGFFFGTYKDDLMFPERLHDAGLRTLGAFAHGYFKPKAAGFDHGFDVWKVVPNLKWDSTTDPNITSPRQEALAEDILKDPKNTGGRFFAWFHFMDPHDQYMHHPECHDWGKHGRDIYDCEVEFTDAWVGKLVDFIQSQPWGPHTAIVITADHGEAFGEHDFYRHGFELYQVLIRVPWFFLIPGLPPRHIDVNRSHLDLAPTVLDLLGVKADPPLRGQSLVDELSGSAQPQERDIVVDLPRTSDNDRRRALISGHFKVIAFGDDSYYQVYDLQADPGETQDLVKSNKEEARQWIARYKEVSKTIKDVHPYACRTLKGAPEGRDY